jgi:transposase
MTTSSRDSSVHGGCCRLDRLPTFRRVGPATPADTELMPAAVAKHGSILTGANLHLATSGTRRSASSGSVCCRHAAEYGSVPGRANVALSLCFGGHAAAFTTAVDALATDDQHKPACGTVSLAYCSQGGCGTKVVPSGTFNRIPGCRRTSLTAGVNRAFFCRPDVRDWLPADHLAWFAIDAVGKMDVSAFYAVYRADGRGRAAYEASMMVRLVLYANATKVRSSRAIECHCRQDVAYRVITGNVVPDHATLARFVVLAEQISQRPLGRGWPGTRARRRAATPLRSRARCWPSTRRPMTPKMSS